MMTKKKKLHNSSKSNFEKEKEIFFMNLYTGGSGIPCFLHPGMFRFVLIKISLKVSDEGSFFLQGPKID